MSEDEESTGSIALDWQVMVCNVIRDILEGRPTNPGFWLSLEKCSENQLEIIFSVSVFFFTIQTVQPRKYHEYFRSNYRVNLR